MKTLPGQEVTASDYAELLARVDAFLWALVYQPVVDVVRPELPRAVRPELATRALRDASPAELRNAADEEGLEALKRGLRDGAVQMVPDHTGKYALFAVAKPSKRLSDGLRAIGAKLNKTTGYWAVAPVQVPLWARFEAESYALRARGAHDRVKGVLDGIEEAVDRAVDEFNFSKGVDHAVREVARGWQASAKALEVVPNLGPAGVDALARGFAANAKIPIKNLAKEAVARLRVQVDENAMQGYRAAGLAERIRSEYGVSKGRADLIARQETNNFMAAYREAAALDAGLRRYVWTIVGDARTRPLHRELPKLDVGYGKGIFSYIEKAPAAYMSFKKPCNPGQDVLCRCRDRAIIE